MDEDILDESEKGKETRLLGALKWWEKKRFIYNIVVGVSGLIGISIMSTSLIVFDFLGILMYGLVVNVFYSLGFVLEGLNIYYFKGRFDMSSSRMALFLIGTFFSCLITFFGALLYYYSLNFAPF